MRVFCSASGTLLLSLHLTIARSTMGPILDTVLIYVHRHSAIVVVPTDTGQVTNCRMVPALMAPQRITPTTLTGTRMDLQALVDTYINSLTRTYGTIEGPSCPRMQLSLPTKPRISIIQMIPLLVECIFAQI